MLNDFILINAAQPLHTYFSIRYITVTTGRSLAALLDQAFLSQSAVFDNGVLRQLHDQGGLFGRAELGASADLKSKVSVE